MKPSDTENMSTQPTSEQVERQTDLTTLALNYKQRAELAEAEVRRLSEQNAEILRLSLEFVKERDEARAQVAALFAARAGTAPARGLPPCDHDECGVTGCKRTAPDPRDALIQQLRGALEFGRKIGDECSRGYLVQFYTLADAALSTTPASASWGFCFSEAEQLMRQAGLPDDEIDRARAFHSSGRPASASASAEMEGLRKLATEVAGILDEPEAIRVCESGGPENMAASLAVTFAKMRADRDRLDAIEELFCGAGFRAWDAFMGAASQK